MSANMEKLRQFSKTNNVSFELLAKAAGIDLSTFYRKVKSGGDGFTIGEVHAMVNGGLMKRADAIHVFLNKTCKNASSERRMGRAMKAIG